MLRPMQPSGRAMTDVLDAYLVYARWAIAYGHPSLAIAPILLVMAAILVVPVRLAGRWRDTYVPRHAEEVTE